ncbi:Sugar (pentulose or hexulose) kinase [Actinacidiphila yanglinensis]|uniref:Sugar (Pentulose or hexulose) kinase n=1 Tax=Actinacidiphila yanglinensis TaxID=310779 RepID=A0A1H6E031_9ACTN|nr:FGGY family carbohydrate kinase [Actinacidiphila yanglinensis]SEG90821.1 Sugar (pentulose or hexulose) kinase [Actinacidiphila yanglinensis]
MTDPSDAPGQDVWLGIDLGTQSVRALAVTDRGRVLGRGSAPLTGVRDGVRHEQFPSDWWEGVGAAVRETLRPLTAARVRGLAVCGTSGTVLLTDSRGTPLTPALMYDDGRAAAEAREAQETGAEVWDALGYRIQPSWALAKLLWLVRREEAGAAALRGARVCHQADFVTTRLVGRPVPADSSHALKTGYDLHGRAWPRVVHEQLGLSEIDFPQVVAPGTLLGTVCAEAAALTGLAEGTPVVAGMTDGCAAQLGSGAWDVGQWNTVLGTTLVIKGVTASPLADPAGVLYNHRSADGNWLPGGASSVGAGALTRAFPGADLPRLDRAAAGHEPSSVLSYPLVSPGERFPFLAPDAEAFTLGTPAGDGDLHASLLQGVAYVERLCLAYVRQLGARIEGPVAFTGGATTSAYWNQLRADVLGRPATIPEQADSALGMAVLAAHGVGAAEASGTASGATSGDGAPPLSALRPMVRVRTTLEPRPEVSRRFDEPFAAMLDAWEQRGWLPAETAAYAREHG